MAELSPMMKQYFSIKEQCPDTILFYRLGDFYEMFYEDAKIVSKELEITLTGRDCGQEERAPMCGVPFHSCDGYIARLVSAGYKVAICEQVEDPATAKGIVKREIIRVITPGTIIEGNMLDESKNNFLSVLFIDEKTNRIGLLFADISTGEIYATEIANDKMGIQNIKNELSKFMPSEILINQVVLNYEEISQFIKEKLSVNLELLNDIDFEREQAKKDVKRHFQNGSSIDIGLAQDSILFEPLGALLCYLKRTQIEGYERVKSLKIYSNSQFMKVDISTRRNLELIETMRNKEKKGSLLWVLDKTSTSMGKRLLRSFIERPLVNCPQIIKRLNSVEELFDDNIKRATIIEHLSGIFDMERLMTRVVCGTSTAREIQSLAYTFDKLPMLKTELKDCDSMLLKEIYGDIDTLEDVCTLIHSAINEELPLTMKEGKIIKEGYNEELDELRLDMTDSHSIMARLEAQQREKTGIKNLKIGYNKVFGYYIEVINSAKDSVPQEYIRKQTLTNCERYITQELKDLEGRVLGATQRAEQLEYQLFCEIRVQVSQQLERIQRTAQAIALLDVLSSFAQVSVDNNYSRPMVNLGGKINLKDSRHPVVEALLNGKPFVPNDIELDKNKNRIAIITGPNMSGKSTYMRQIALIVLMAQIGCFVPAQDAEIGIVDSIFTRVGASDDLASGQSTFMVEMNEVANILKNATSDSLVILDEIGRGTSTFDGMSIARSVVEYIADKKKIGAKTLFATHYHELTELENFIDGVNNYSIAVKKRGDDITFLRRIIKQPADESYGIEVAKLAGVPDWVVSRSKRILKDLESTNGKIKLKNDTGTILEEPQIQQLSMNLSDKDKLIDTIQSIDVNNLTPMDAMTKLFELWKKAQSIK